MAIAELTQEAYVAFEAASEGIGKVRVGVHDASRLEWSLSMPLPEGTQPSAYALKVEMQIPQNAFVRHVPWDQMQAFTRLDGPATFTIDDVIEAGEDPTKVGKAIDALRRGALARASQLARTADGFQRHCRLAASLFATAPHSELEDALAIWIEAAVRIAEEARERLERTRRPRERGTSDSASGANEPRTETANEAAELARERRLVDEYISVRLLEMLASAERALSNVVSAKSAHAARLGPVVQAVESRLGEALAAELAYRVERGFTNADPDSPQDLERYLDRASRLKKHFQEVLFLEPETFQVAERAYHWIAGFVAVIASTWAFAWQIALASRASAATTVSSSLLALAMVAGLVYATKDRIKEIGRNWMTRRVHRVWGAQRITRYRAPRRRLPGRDVIVSARESFHQGVVQQPDPLNPECGASTAVAVLTYEHNGEVLPNTQLLASGVRRVKHVFRYDLSPLFARLDDATKPVPVLDDVSRRVRFIDAPRCYRLPLSVEVTQNGETYRERGTLVLHKRGLERIESCEIDEDAPPREDSNPSLNEVGIEPN